MNKHAVPLFIVVLILGWASDILFWKQPVGINFAIFAVLCLLAGLSLLPYSGLRPAQKSLWLLAPVIFFSVISFLRREPLTAGLAYTFTVFSMGVFAVTYLGGRWPRYGLLDYFYKFFQLSGSVIVRPLDFILKTRKEWIAKSEGRRRVAAGPVVRGLFIAVPVVFIFGWLLTSADLIFSKKVADFFNETLNFDHFFENLLRLILVLLWAYGLAGTFLHAAEKSRDEKLIGEDRPLLQRFMGFTEASIVLGSVAALFLAFVIVQFQYFFGGRENIGGVEGFTFSEYARRGFSELVTVGILSLLLVLGLNAIVKRETRIQQRVYSGLSVAVLGMVLVILLSAYYRISLAMGWHGFSRLRLYPRVFLIWVGILFIAVVVLEIAQRERFFAFAALLASFGFAISLSLVNIDASIVHHNVNRAVQGFHFNVNYLSSLSTDAVPALAEEYKDTTLPEEVHEGVGAALMCYTRGDDVYRASGADWQSFTLSQWQSSTALDEVRGELKGYKMNVEDWVVRVGTPHNVWYECALPGTVAQ